ncbi:MAG TPA: hypothetical protein VNO33_12810 [Kofleriaceae bacterium]|nr:hypothetical protein [Kofleriaceae bacterium]
MIASALRGGSLALCIAAACASAPEVRPPPVTHEREAVVEGRRLRYRLQLAELPNLVYQLDCITGAALCAQVIYRELWDSFALDAGDRAALANWKALRTRHAGEIRRVERRPQPLLAPSGGFDLAERQRIAGLRARTPRAYQEAIALLSTDADARQLRRVIERFAPRFKTWWRQRGFAAGSPFFDGFLRLLSDPFLDRTIDSAARFYEADLPAGTVFQVHLLVQPRSSRKLSVAYQLEGDAVVEAPEGGDPRRLIDVVAHELFHYLFFRTAPARQAALLERVCASDDRTAAVAFGMMDEALAAALGNGVVGRHYLPAANFEKQLAKGFVNYQAAGSVAREIYPSMAGFLARGTAVSSDEFLRAFYAAARRTYLGGHPRPLDHLHSQVSVAGPHSERARARLRDEAWAGFPYLREYTGLDGEARAFLAAHPFISSAIFLDGDTRMTAALESLGAARHIDAVSSLARRTRGFVYALPRTPKSYAFLFVARDAPTMDELVERFIALPAGRDGLLVELPR